MSRFSYSNQDDYTCFLLVVDVLGRVREICIRTKMIRIQYDTQIACVNKLCDMLDSQGEELEEVEKVSKNILKELQKRQNSRTKSTTGRRCSKKEQKVDPFCRVSHLSR